MRGLEGYREFEFFRGKVRFKQPKAHRLSIVEILFVANLKGIKKSSKVVDLGAGFGALSILTALRYQCQVWAIERDPIMLELLRYNVKVNNLEDRIHILDLDLRYIKEDLSPHIFDVAIANPPFYKGQAKDNIYHHESDTSLEDFIKSGSFLLKDGRGFNILIASNRLVEALMHIKKYNMNAASLRIFYPKHDKNGKITHIYALKNLNPALIIEKPLIINEKGGEYTQEVKNILESFL